MIDDPLIRIEDVRLAGYCARGARPWFEKHGINFRDFLKNGIPSSTLIDKGDELAKIVVDRRKERDRG